MPSRLSVSRFSSAATLCLAVGALAPLVSCTEIPAAEIPSAEFDDLFEIVTEIELEEPPGQAITRVRSLSIGSDGRLFVPDNVENTVRVFGRDGRLVERVGRTGEGPGELRAPTAAEPLDDGRLAIFESLNRRISFFTSSFVFDTLWALPAEVRGGGRMLTHSNDIIIHSLPFPWDGDRPVFRRLSPDGDLVATYHPQDSAYYTAAYWRMHPEPIAIDGAGNKYIASDKLYPIHRYSVDGQLIRRFGSPPRSWRQASRPVPNQFSGPGGRNQFEKWLRTYTWIDEIAIVSDSLLLVVHADLDPKEIAYRVPSYRADVYDRIGLTKLVEDVEMPGRLLMAEGDEVFVLTAEPPRPWTISVYRLVADPGGED